MIKFIQKQKNKEGFTMIELIIVIAVMAILAAIVVPRMAGITNSFKKKADERMCATFAREIQTLIEIGESVSFKPTDGTAATLGEVKDLISDNDAKPQFQNSSKTLVYRYLYVASSKILTVYVSEGALTTFANTVINVEVKNVAEIK